MTPGRTLKKTLRRAPAKGSVQRDRKSDRKTPSPIIIKQRTPAPAVDAGQMVRDRQRNLMSRIRAAAREVEIPPVKDPRRRGRCKNDPERFCQTYLPQFFYNPFSADQRTIIKAIHQRIRTGANQAIAAERGGGKTSITLALGGVWAMAYGHVRYLVILSANGDLAAGALEDIKGIYEFSDILAEDFPEICAPVIALEGAPQRAGGQTANGQRTRMKWAGREIILPTVIIDGKPSAASGGVITARGIDAAIRGLVKRGLRPDLAIGDDIETRESVLSLTETKKRKSILGGDVLGLSGPSRPMSVLLLGTIYRKGCILDQLLDRKTNPAWHGIKQKRLIQKPDAEDLWVKYIELRKQEQEVEGKTDQQIERTAHQFYLARRKQMDAGAIVSNRRRFADVKTPDGGRLQVSALQACYDDVADMGWDHFNAEYQNEPTDEAVETTGLQISNIQQKTNGLPRGVIPSWCQILTAGVDVGRRVLHWSIMAWQQGAIGAVVDYGVHDVHSPLGSLAEKDVQQAQDQAIFTALQSWADMIESTGYVIEGQTQTRVINICLIDSGWLPDPVHQFCRLRQAERPGCYRPSRGFGTNSRQGRYRQGARVRGGALHWQPTRRNRQYRWDLDVDYYKQRVHDGFATPAGQNGALSLFGNDPAPHYAFAEHLMSEIWSREFVAGKGWVETWQVRHKRNHWLDTTVYNIAAAEIAGIRLIQAGPEHAPALAVAAGRQAQAIRRGPRQRREGGFLDNLPKLI